MSDALESRLLRLERDLGRLQSVQAIQNLMGRHTTNWIPKRTHLAGESFALTQADVSIEIADRGVWIGPQRVLDFYQRTVMPPAPGNMLIHYLATPMIEIAGDGKTAKGVWRSPGIESVVPPGGGSPVPLWSFGAYAIDFIREGEDWKMWHYHWFRFIKCSFEAGWVDDTSMAHTGLLPDSPVDLRPSTHHNPYTAATVQDAIPPCPVPYETWDGSDWMNREQS